MRPLALAIQSYADGQIGLDAVMAQAAQQGLEQRDLGAVYTPQHIVARILDRLDPQPHHHILEPAVGRGAFLIPLLERTTAQMTPEAALDWLCGHTHAIDIDPEALADLDAILRAWFVRRWNWRVPLDRFPNLHAADGLAAPLPRHFDIALGNPPYIRFQTLPPAQRAWLQKHYRSCAKGNVDLYYAFIERALQAADRVGFIVPNSFLTTQSGQALRGLLDGRVSDILDFGAERVFPGVGTYTCLLFAQAAATQATITDAATGASRPFAPHTARPAPVRTALAGIATLCDKAYMVERQGARFTARLTGLPIEAALVRPFIKITKFRDAHPDWDSFILHPYADGQPLTPAQMAQFPQAMAHLEAVRPLLEARDRGKTHGYPQWYAYGRAQGLTPLHGPQALLVPAMLGGQAQPRLANLTPLLAWGKPLFCSGYAVDAPTAADIDALTSDRFLDTVRAHGAPKPGTGGSVFYSVASWMVKGQR